MTRDDRTCEEPGHKNPAHGERTGEGAATGGLDWLLDDLIARTDHVRQAVLLTSDGLADSASHGMCKADIDHLAAVSAGFHSLAKDVGTRFGAGAVRQTMVMLDDAYLFVTQAGDRSRLAVLCDAEADIGQLAYELSLLVKRAGRHMASRTRSADENPGG